VEGAGEGVRDEIRAPLAPDVPDALRDLVTPFARGAALEPVAALRTERTPRLLVDTAGTARAEVVDDTVCVLDGERETERFREIEVEALTDIPDEQVLTGVADLLLATGAVPGTTSKAGAALGPRAAVPADVPELAWPSPEDPAGEVVRAYLARHVRRLLLADLRLRRDLPDAVHQMRVSARRLRSGLKAFLPLLDDAWARALRVELGWMASELGAARDTEVLRERLDAQAGALGDMDADIARRIIDRELTMRADRASADVRAVVDSPRYRALLESLVESVRDLPLTALADGSARTSLPPLVAKAVRRLDKRARRLDMDTPSAVWHEARIAAKQARYAADAVAPVLGGGIAHLAERLAEVTDLLGHHQDAYVAQETIRGLVPLADPAGAFALGRLLAVEEAAEAADRQAFLGLWPAVHRAARQADLP
jgi:CHAD domain-containing protein